MIDLTKITVYTKPREISREEFIAYIADEEELFGFRGYVEMDIGRLEDSVPVGFENSSVAIYSEGDEPSYRQKTWNEYICGVYRVSLDEAKMVMSLGYRVNRCRFKHLTSKELYDYVGEFGVENILTRDEYYELINSNRYKKV